MGLFQPLRGPDPLYGQIIAPFHSISPEPPPSARPYCPCRTGRLVYVYVWVAALNRTGLSNQGTGSCSVRMPAGIRLGLIICLFALPYRLSAQQLSPTNGAPATATRRPARWVDLKPIAVQAHVFVETPELAKLPPESPNEALAEGGAIHEIPIPLRAAKTLQPIRENPTTYGREREMGRSKSSG